MLKTAKKNDALEGIMRNITLIGYTIFALLVESANASAASKNGFDLDGALVPAEEILSGGPPRDGIPAIDKPVFVNASMARTLRDDDRVLAITHRGISKAYPVRIMNWHEVVNDQFGDDSVAITYCPLCGSGIAFKSEAAGKTLKFGVSGLLFNSDVLLFDRQTQSLWSQILAQAVSGPMKGNNLTAISIIHTSWADWRKRQPDTLVLTEETGFVRDYAENPYSGYEKREETIFPVKFRTKGYHPKERVLGLLIGGKAKAYPFLELAKVAGASAEVSDTIGGRRVLVRYSQTHQSADAFDERGKAIAGMTMFWFAWYTFHPETEIYRAPEK